jgi:DNA-binding transcriptional MerR regulator
MSKLLERLEQGKLYYSISEVCRMTGLEPHVLRYWETEFSQMRPRKNRAGNRAYRTREIEYIRFIRHLLHEEKYTLQGAKKKLSELSFEEVSGQTSLLKGAGETQAASGAPAIASNAAEPPAKEKPQGVAPELRKELEGIRDGLKDVLKLLAP